MTSSNLLLLLGIIACGGTGYYLYKRYRIQFPIEIIDRIISLKEIIAYFKTLDLDRDQHSPFLGVVNRIVNKKILPKYHFPPMKHGYTCLLVGVFDKHSNAIDKGKILYVKGLADDLKNIIGEEDLITLS